MQSSIFNCACVNKTTNRTISQMSSPSSSSSSTSNPTTPPSTIKNLGLLIVSFYIVVFVGLAYVTQFLETDLKGVVMGTEQGTKFPNTVISNFSDLYRCSPVVGEESNVAAIRVTLGFVIAAQLVCFLVISYMLYKVLKANSTVLIVAEACLFIVFLVINVPLWILVDRLQTKNLLRFTDNSRNYDCIKFTTKKNVQNVLNLTKGSWYVSFAQVLLILGYSFFYGILYGPIS